MNQHVDATERCCRSFHAMRCFRCFADIGDYHRTTPAQRLDLGFDLRGVVVRRAAINRHISSSDEPIPPPVGRP